MIGNVKPARTVRLIVRWGLTCLLLFLMGLFWPGLVFPDHLALPIARADELASLNSLVTDEQPALSGNGRFIGFVSDRDGVNQLLLYDLQQHTFIDLPFLNRPDAIIQSPSLSYSARYIVYLASDSRRPEIYLYDSKTHYAKAVTRRYPGWVRHPSISADGRYITFETGRRGQWDIAIVDRGPRIQLDKIPNR